ncbi:hypothetical protein FNAPI_13441 [Fusarium napiforme]|uniref:Uncharacterized protein n=1 Tax=Fusarium napiforme TaxID=42672 RepID=A0A8H5I7F2_9HYPO|nr:hypothetical protein FNAPI_13441 [Fusarium napiforme]
MTEPTENGRLRARQFQRFYHHKPPLENRDLISEADLKSAFFHEPDYELSKCAVGEVEFPPEWATKRITLLRTVTNKAWSDVRNSLREAQALLNRSNSALPAPEVENVPAVTPDETESSETTAAKAQGATQRSKTMKYLRSALATPGPDSMPGGWAEGEEFPFTEKQVARYLRWTKKQDGGHGKELGETY